MQARRIEHKRRESSLSQQAQSDASTFGGEFLVALRDCFASHDSFFRLSDRSHDDEEDVMSHMYEDFLASLPRRASPIPDATLQVRGFLLFCSFSSFHGDLILRFMLRHHCRRLVTRQLFRNNGWPLLLCSRLCLM